MCLYTSREDMNSLSLTHSSIIGHLGIYDASRSVHLEEKKKSMNIFSNSSGKSHYCVESPVFLLPLDLPPLFAAIFLWIYFQ